MTALARARTRILLVEDDESFAQIFAVTLEQKFGCEVLIALDSFEAARLIQSRGIDLIVADWLISDQTALLVLNRSERKIPMIVVTDCDSPKLENERIVKKKFQFLGVVSKEQELAGIIDQIEMIFGNFPDRATA